MKINLIEILIIVAIVATLLMAVIIPSARNGVDRQSSKENSHIKIIEHHGSLGEPGSYLYEVDGIRFFVVQNYGIARL